jgi:hypothetical protein
MCCFSAKREALRRKTKDWLFIVSYHYEKKVNTVMVNHSNNINKTNNHLLPETIQQMTNDIEN